MINFVNLSIAYLISSVVYRLQIGNCLDFYTYNWSRGQKKPSHAGKMNLVEIWSLPFSSIGASVMKEAKL